MRSATNAFAMRESETMTTRSRIAAFGSAGVLVVAGAVCAAVIGGGTGQILALVFIGVGLVLATSLVFLEVGLSEDRDRARERKATSRKRASRSRRVERAKPERSRGHRRRLR
jgi:hypothetical protein